MGGRGAWHGPARSTQLSRPCSDSTVAPRPCRHGSPAEGRGEGRRGPAMAAAAMDPPWTPVGEGEG